MSTSTTQAIGLPGENALEHQILRQGTDGWELVGSRCQACGRHSYPPRQLCPLDLGACEDVSLSGEGVLYAITQIHVAPVGFTAPFWLGYVDLPEEVRVFAQIQPVDEQEPRRGDRVRVEFRTVRTDPREVVGPVFCVAE